MSQATLGDALGIGPQQVQKYESGLNRISASRLQRMANVLQAPVAFFFEGLPDQSANANDQGASTLLPDVTDFLATSDGLTLAKAFMKIDNQKLRFAIVHLVEDLASRA